MMAVVTGGSRGIGYAVAEELVRRECQVVVVARDRARGEQAVSALGPASLVVADLSTIAGIQSAADQILDQCPKIDVFVHNAGIWPTRLVRTPDGLEQAFAVNHLAPFLLNHLLEPRLRDSATRVVQVSAGLFVKGRYDPQRTPTGEDFHRMRTYCTTKLANLLTVPVFAERWRNTGVTIDAVHPGVIKTDLGDTGGLLGLLMKFVKRSWAPPASGAKPVVRLAFTTGNGRYFDQNALAEGPKDPVLAQRVWDQAVAYVP
ncbi:NAD(P)-dependent dehydrogenase (short-subunit alcohol dehydrogenase family) [Kibdelosporangium banguiense]|uniref:NAD(P)-dependent dehydrogenase (Short-subunit alcohol dehydrogenase family) n=1 Tax=Kibdelosporangium banguiense TaxID=1365924 RepID=A0ABS4TTH5_9PSEU|nr:SDR family NAD(P)-dependent oxidoreductase [Kibdelosporangium banguiense]MBP2327706.1 NAD(P)-dependent dehydrogenase (short-subunit alcohol dehydrogenase family) [Kibdelosporangium banguiense]